MLINFYNNDLAIRNHYAISSHTIVDDTIVMKQDTITTIPFNNYIISSGSGMSKTSDGGITIPAGAYAICGSVYIDHDKVSSNGRVGRSVHVFDSNDIEYICARFNQYLVANTGPYEGYSTGTKIIVFNKQTTLYLKARSLSVSASAFLTNTGTFLSIIRLR